ncbi:MAG: hypothetical protein J5820_03255 [Rhodocyclaceae bacterium]|nr:hypothetical protein [Rhodocyclaceae bacterium]
MAQQDVRIKLIMDGAQGVTAVTGAFNGLEQGITRSAKAAESLTSHVARMGHIAVTAFSFGKIAQVADTFTALNAQLKIATGSASNAQRVYQNVLDIAMSTGQALEYQAEEAIRFVQVRMSRTHPDADICDYHAGVDLYGLGKGIYPKEKAPLPPYHPHCRCVLAPRIDIAEDAPIHENPHAGRDWLARQDATAAARIAGNRQARDAVLNEGADLITLTDARQQHARYRTRYAGDVRDADLAVYGSIPRHPWQPVFSMVQPDDVAARILQGEAVASVSRADALPGGRVAVAHAAAEIFRQQGGQAAREDIGASLLDLTGAKDSAFHGHLSQIKRATFSAIQSVTERGALVLHARHGIKNEGGHSVDSFYICAPVLIDGVENIMGVIVRCTKEKQYAYVHEVATKRSLLSRWAGERLKGERIRKRTTEGSDNIAQDIKQGKFAREEINARLHHLLTMKH